ncbi:MAG: NADH-quinone oxidoreductase subunit, partial [Dehalococcoidia bacterium]|nr:NADH-quinone oxidoreductase subunit [Dehalococcoidia bacterium]
RMALVLSMVLVVAGFGFKMATVPFHMWVPDVYEGAPTPITAFLSVASKSAGFAVVLRLFHTALGDTQLSADWSNLFAVLSALSMTLGNVVAVQQSNIKRMMGYSSIAHAGFIMVGLAVVPQLGPSGVIFYLLAYAFTNLGAFIAIIAISNKINSDLIADYAGVARRAPGLALALTLCLMSLTGIPPTAGFVAKFYIFNAAIQQGLLWLVLVGVINSVVSAYFYMGVVKAMYLGAPSTEESISTPAPIAIALATATIGVLLVGILPGAVIQAAAAAIGTLIP